MNNAHHMCMLQTFCDGNSDFHRFLNGYTRMMLNVFFQRTTCYIFHNNIVKALIVAYVIHAHHILMIQFTRCLRLSFKASYEILITTKVLVQNFNRHRSTQ